MGSSLDSYSTPNKSVPASGQWSGNLPPSAHGTPQSTPATPLQRTQQEIPAQQAMQQGPDQDAAAAAVPLQLPPQLKPGELVGKREGEAVLKTATLKWLWSFMNTCAVLFIYLYILLPYSIFYLLMPAFLKPAVNQVANGTWESFALPATTFLQQSIFWVFHLADTVVATIWRRAANIHKANMNHFSVALEGYLRLIERKANTVARDGIVGVPKALFER